MRFSRFALEHHVHRNDHTHRDDGQNGDDGVVDQFNRSSESHDRVEHACVEDA